MKREIVHAILLGAAFILCASCDKVQPDTPLTEEQKVQYKYANTFLYNSMATYYLWIDDAGVNKKMQSWKTSAEPIGYVEEVKHPDDRWTQATDDFDSFTSSTTGIGTTYGYDIQLYWADSSKSAVVAVITLVYPDSPAAKAGLKRGDVIVKVNGKALKAVDYVSIVNDEMYNSSSVKLTKIDGTELSLTSVTMYENPVLCNKILNIGGKKYGYLFFNSFTLKSVPDLVEAASQFKEEGISALILDLRYNGGGYVSTEQVLASLCAPYEEVKSQSIFQKTKYNKTLSEAMGEESKSFLATFKDEESGMTYDLLNANMDLDKIYAIVTSSSASASEGLITGLLPYMDITIVGEQTHGKFCTGILMSALGWFADMMNPERWSQASKYEDFKASYSDYKKYVDNWGLYVMIGRFSDKDGNTPCMPSGFTPDVYAADAPEEGFEFGSEYESMLKVVMGLITGTSDSPTKAGLSAGPELTPYQHRPANFGMLIENHKK